MFLTQLYKGDKIILNMQSNPLHGKQGVVVFAPFYHNWQTIETYTITINFGSKPYSVIAFKYLKRGE